MVSLEVKVAQSCPTFCDPMDYTVYGILQARILDWVTFPFSGGSSQPRDRTQVSSVAGGFFTSWATREDHSKFRFASLRNCQTVFQNGRAILDSRLGLWTTILQTMKPAKTCQVICWKSTWAVKCWSWGSDLVFLFFFFFSTLGRVCTFKTNTQNATDNE